MPHPYATEAMITRQEVELLFDSTIAIGLFLFGLARKTQVKERLVVANFTKRQGRAFR
jgi:hypothetical protein